MLRTSTHIAVSFGIGFLFYFFQKILGSTFLIEFLKQNLITIMLALLAINTTTLSIVLTKIRELIDNTKIDTFNKTKSSMLSSIIEQIVLVVLSLILFIILDSVWIIGKINIELFIHVTCIAVFIYDIQILYDTCKSVFVILSYNK